MFSLCSAFLAVYLLNFLHDFHVSSCETNCAEYPVFTPSRVVVKFGDPTSASCLVCQHDCPSKTFGFKKSVGQHTNTTILWEVKSLTKWDIDDIQCYYTKDDGTECCSGLPITVYQPPTVVSLQAGPMVAGHEYKLQCHVQEVAPVGNLSVTFYRGQTELGSLQSNNTEKTPVNETFTLDINPSKEDDGEQYWCEAKLDLGAEGPQYPPVVKSGNLTATVYYKPQLKESSHPDPITVTEGDPLQLDCSAVGNPRPSYNWTLPSASGSSFSDSVFTVKSVTLEDKGQYICSVHNKFGNVTVEFNVDVKYEPQLKGSSRPDPITVTEGDPLQLNCSAEGNPRPSYKWTLPSTRRSSFNDSVFTVTSVTLEDKGQYICSVHNDVGNVTVEFDVHVKDKNCADKPVFTPSRLVVKFGDPASAECLTCQHDCQNKTFGSEKSVGKFTRDGAKILWKVDKMTEWDTDFHNDDDGTQCCRGLPVTVYQPPKNVSFSFLNPAKQMFAGRKYKLQCNVQEVAPVGNFNVTFYRGQTELGSLQSSNTEKTPVTETFTLDIKPSKEDDGEQYWCEAKLDLGTEGPKPPPVVKSGKLTATVHYEPQLKVSSRSDLITVTKGSRLQLDCSAEGNPSPSYNWTLLSVSGSSFNDSVFTIESVTLEDEGQYICFVYNDIGNVTRTFNVDVKENYTVLILLALSVVVLAVIGFVTVYCCHKYKHARKGRYNLKDVFHYHSQLVTGSTGELICE